MRTLGGFYFNGKCRYKYSIVIIPEESRGLFQLMGTGDPKAPNAKP